MSSIHLYGADKDQAINFSTKIAEEGFVTEKIKHGPRINACPLVVSDDILDVEIN